MKKVFFWTGCHKTAGFYFETGRFWAATTAKNRCRLSKVTALQPSI
jgi:hypothetical protein